VTATVYRYNILGKKTFLFEAQKRRSEAAKNIPRGMKSTQFVYFSSMYFEIVTPNLG
jgi:hypothetical protein